MSKFPQREVESDSRKDGGAQPVVVAEGGKAPHAVARVDQTVVIDGASGGRQYASGKPKPTSQRPADVGNEKQAHRITQHDRSDIEAAKKE